LNGIGNEIVTSTPNRRLQNNDLSLSRASAAGGNGTMSDGTKPGRRFPLAFLHNALYFPTMKISELGVLHQLLFVGFAWMLVFSGCTTQPFSSTLPPGVSYQHRIETEPRPQHIHILDVDLRKAAHRLMVAMPPDPDGPGPAETRLTPPLTLAESAGVQVGVNANAWQTLPAPGVTQSKGHPPGAFANVGGWVLDTQGIRSPSGSWEWSFWLDQTGRGRVGRVEDPPPARLAVSGFGGLLEKGTVLPGAGTPRHPRTALGVNRDGTRLWIVVVDGRQPGYSEGMTEVELAETLKSLGASDALNLDGGGSSMMVLRGNTGTLAIVNRPSGFSVRPVPVMLGLR
jgi:hypothetical protein